MNNPVHSMAGPISGRQRAIVAVLRAGLEASIVRVRIIGHLRVFCPYPRGCYTQRQLTHSGPVLSLLRPLINTGRQCAGRQSGLMGRKSLLMTLCPSIIILLYIIFYDNIPYYSISQYIIPCDNIWYDKVFKSGSILHACATPPPPKKMDPLFTGGPNLENGNCQK